MQEIKTTIKLTTDDIIREKLLAVINGYKVTLETLSRVMQIETAWLSEYIDSRKQITDLPAEKQELISLIIMLSDGMRMINEDERVKSVIDTLTGLFGVKYETISLYAGLDKHDVETFMHDTTLVGYEKKYKIAVTSLMLHYLFKNPSNSRLLRKNTIEL